MSSRDEARERAWNWWSYEPGNTLSNPNECEQAFEAGWKSCHAARDAEVEKLTQKLSATTLEIERVATIAEERGRVAGRNSARDACLDWAQSRVEAGGVKNLEAARVLGLLAAKLEAK